jgi:hypothetical protein
MRQRSLKPFIDWNGDPDPKGPLQMYAEVVTRVAGSLGAIGLPGYPEVLIIEINVMKSWQSLVALYFSQ